MKNKTTNTQRNFLMLCPLAVFLFFSHAFWTMGGGQKSTAFSGGMIEKFKHQPSPANPNLVNQRNKHSYHQKANNVKSVIRNTQNADDAINKLVTKSSISLKPIQEHRIRRISNKVSTGNMTKYK